MNKVLFFDLDNVICKTYKNFYKNSLPKKKVINFINYLYDNDYIINIYTARFMKKFNGNKKKVIKYGYNFTKKQLLKWKLKFHKLILCKPSYDYFVDDKAIGFSSKWIKEMKLKLNIKK